LLHHLDDVPAMHLEDLVDIGAGHSGRHEDLDDELVARRQVEVGRRAQPPLELGHPFGGERNAFCGPGSSTPSSDSISPSRSSLCRVV
jgi:hypothetical protein